MRTGTENKYERAYSGPYAIQKVCNNGTVRITKGAVTETVNLRRLQPYRKRHPDILHGGECSMRRSKRARVARQSR